MYDKFISQVYVYIYIFVTYYLQPPNQPPKSIYYANILLLKKKIDYQLPNQPKNKIYSILFLFIYISSQKLATNYSELFMATKKHLFFLWPKPSLFMGFLGAHGTNPTNDFIPKLSPRKARCCTRRGAVPSWRTAANASSVACKATTSVSWEDLG